MNKNKNNKGVTLLGTLLMVAMWCGQGAQAVPIGVVDFTAGSASGHFEFEFANGVSEYTGSPCVTCVLTDFSMTDLFGKQWNSTGVGDGGVTSFSLRFDVLGDVLGWGFGLQNYALGCDAGGPEIADKIGCSGKVSTLELSSQAIQQGASFSWPGINKQQCAPNGGECESTLIQAPGAATTSSIAFMDFSADIRLQPTVPEPSSIALLGLGLAGLAGIRKRRHAA